MTHGLIYALILTLKPIVMCVCRRYPLLQKQSGKRNLTYLNLCFEHIVITYNYYYRSYSNSC